MRKFVFFCCMTAAGINLLTSGAAYAAPAGGAQLYQQYCAACHDPPGVPRAPGRQALQLMSADALVFALTRGNMAEQGKALNRVELRQLVRYLSNPTSAGDWTAALTCAPPQRTIDLQATPAMTMVGTNLSAHRNLSPAQAGLTRQQLGHLELAWAVAFPQTSSLRAGGVVVGNTLFYSPTQTGAVLAMDTHSGCVKWTYQHTTPLRTSLSLGQLGNNGALALVFADAEGQVHTVNPLTGKLIWKAEGRHDKRVHITGAPLVYNGLIIVPVSARGVGQGRNPKFECCTTHGAVVALDANTGEQVWVYETMPDAQYTGETNSLGVKLRGPSGAPIWASLSVDTQENVVYAATGEGTSLPATDTSDAILAIDLDSGELRWSFQGLANDIWNLGCDIRSGVNGPNCPDAKRSVLKDFDFGAAPVLVESSERRLVLGGQKSGDVWALDAQAEGKVVWRQTFGMGSALGGIHWGIATDGQRVYAPINDPTLPIEGYVPEPGMNAIDLATGEVLWRQAVQADCAPARRERHPLCAEMFGLSAAPLVIDQAVVSAAVDGRIYIFDGASGNLLWEYDTLRSFDTVNGLDGRGGAIDSQSIFAGDGMLFVGSGYAGFQQPAGNVLLAFKPKSPKSKPGD